MWQLKLFILSGLMILASITTGQTQTLRIPFQLTAHNNIAVPAILNDTDTLHLMFHTAASDVTLTEDATKKLKSIRFNGTTDGIKSWGGAENTARYSARNTLRIGGRLLSGIEIWENKFSGPNTDGKFGLDLFKGQCVQLDFEQKIMLVSPTLPKKLKKYQQFKLTIEDDLMFIEASCAFGDTVIQHPFLIHSGYSSGLLLDDQFANENKLGEKLKIIGTKDLKDSYGNVIRTQKAILPGLTIGTNTLANVPVGFFEGAIGRQKMSILGGDILKLFQVVIDLKNGDIYLKGNKLGKEGYMKE
ncbi:MAG: hypothetical protein SFV55_27395 [Haliscomenobacter sp.]|uniref:hypothetical protein n=1 Tax=Haliscomenobacter sp. TaxID=2717303 RepID=UPI0029B7A624|nr:hypothetical protein [Haliscomenobacter sp.]MDX2072189.1 hypothetical protein [Haliscomenobacter sp.]